LKTLSIISKFHPLDYQWLLSRRWWKEEEDLVAEVEEELVLEGEEEAVKDHPHLLESLLK
jgi:hypothetical protein